MRFIFGRGWVYCDETNGEGDGKGAAGGAASDAEGEGDDEGDGEGDDLDGGGAAGGAAGAAIEKKEEAPKDMKSAIDAALGYKKGPNGEALDPLTGKAKEPAKPVEKNGEAKETDTHHANGKPKKGEKGEDLDADGKLVVKQAAKPKSAAELDLKPEEKKLLHPKTQARFGELITAVKAHEGTITKQSETIKVLSEARDNIIGVMKDTNTTPEQLGNLLHFNSLIQSDDPKLLEDALGMVEQQRADLYKALGREPQGGGLDLLKDFPDLAKQVEDEEITRAAALEIAKGRRDKAERDRSSQQQQQRQKTEQQTIKQREEAGEAALKEIDAWTKGLAKGDLDYKAKEDKLLSKLDGVLKNYSPDKWLPTLKLLYEGIEIQKAPTTSGKQITPLRPSGAKPGAKAPLSMKEAIDQGLGYAGAAKG